MTEDAPQYAPDHHDAKDRIDNLMEAMKLVERAIHTLTHEGPDVSMRKDLTGIYWQINNNVSILEKYAYTEQPEKPAPTVQDIGVEHDTLNAEGKHRCRQCAATGRFITHIMNGVPKGPGGECYKCAGKGYHTTEDRLRNHNYNMYGQRICP